MKIVFDSLHKPDQAINLIVGDAVSNLRSALDYAVVAITGHQKGAFPVGDTANSFKGEVKGGFIGKVGASAVTFFVDKIQAYDGGNGHPIWTLNKLRNIDKHRFLLTTMQVAAIVLSFRDERGNQFIENTFPVQAGNSGLVFEAPAGRLEFTRQPRPSFNVALMEPPWFPNIPILDVLKTLSESTATCLKTIEEFFT